MRQFELTCQFKFDNILSILRRFNNSFFEAFSCDLHDKLKRTKDEKKTQAAPYEQPPVVLHDYYIPVLELFWVDIPENDRPLFLAQNGLL